MTLEKVIDKIINWILTDGVRLVFALIILYLIFKLINYFTRRIEKKIEKRKKHIDETITRVLLQCARVGLKILAFVCFLGYVGIETTSIAAAITSIGLAVGLALQGSLSNFAGGVIILIMHPYKLGDYIKYNDEEGTVEDVKLFYTYLTTIDNKVVIVPNGKMADSTIVNYTSKKLRRLDMKFNISYDNDLDIAKQAILNSIHKSNLIKENINPFININEYKDRYVELIIKVWCNTSDYWDLFYYLQEDIKKEFDKNNIKLSFNNLKIEVKK